MPPEEISILFRYPSRGAARGIRRIGLREFLRDASKRVAPGLSVTCLITDDTEMRELNRRFRGKDTPTDVLSFPASKFFPSELAISLDRAVEQAAGFGHSVEAELRILMLHGLLHLAGMDHETDSGEMARAEKRWRKALDLPPGLVERATA